MNLNSCTFSRCQKRFENDTSYTFTLVDKNIHKCLSTVMVIFAALCDYYFLSDLACNSHWNNTNISYYLLNGTNIVFEQLGVKFCTNTPGTKPGNHW